MTGPVRRERVTIEDVIAEFEDDFAQRSDIAWPAETIVFDHLSEVLEADLLAHFDVDVVVTLPLYDRDANDLRQRVRQWMAEA